MRRDTNLPLQSSQHPGDPHPSFLAVGMPQGVPVPQASLVSRACTSSQDHILCPGSRRADWSLMLRREGGKRGKGGAGEAGATGPSAAQWGFWLHPFASCVRWGTQLGLSEPLTGPPSSPPSPPVGAKTGRIIIATSSRSCLENSVT